TTSDRADWPALTVWQPLAYASGRLRALHSYPTRRSSDLSPHHTKFLTAGGIGFFPRAASGFQPEETRAARVVAVVLRIFCRHALDRKSTRLNSSHVKISYAVFCLKKKKLINLFLRVAYEH